MHAYAALITEENRQAIASEHPRFDKEEFKAWLEVHEGGYFLRDPSSPFDCRYIDENIFSKMYSFAEPDRGQLFRRVRRA